MNEEQVKAVIDGLDKVAREMEHWKFREDMDRVSVEKMRERVLAGVKLLYDYENMVRALMGEYGDACDVGNDCGGHEHVQACKEQRD